MTMASLRTLIDSASAMVEARLDPAEPLTPHFLVERADGSIAVYALATGGRALDALRRDLDLAFRLDGCRRWVFVAESWLVEYGKGVPAVLAPADHPERLEVIQFDGYDASGDRRMRGSRQILRIGPDAVRLLPMVFSAVRTIDVPAEAGGAHP